MERNDQSPTLKKHVLGGEGEDAKKGVENPEKTSGPSTPLKSPQNSNDEKYCDHPN